MRIVIASLLRIVVAAGIGLAALVLCLGLASTALVTLGRLELAGEHGATELVAWTGVTIGLLLALSRLARLALGQCADVIRPDDRPPS